MGFRPLLPVVVLNNNGGSLAQKSCTANYGRVSISLFISCAPVVFYSMRFPLHRNAGSSYIMENNDIGSARVLLIRYIQMYFN